MIFKLYDCDVGLTIDDVQYFFEHVDSVQIVDPEKTRLTRGANAGNKSGIAYREGLKEAKSITFQIKGISKALHDLLKQVYEDQTRVNAFIVSRKDGSSKTARNAVLGTIPKQLNLDDTPDSMNLQLDLETFDLDEIHKS